MDEHVHIEPGERLEQAAGSDPGVLAARVAAVQPVHVHYTLHEPHHMRVSWREGLGVVELVDELVEHHAALAEPHQRQLRLVQGEFVTPPEWVWFRITAYAARGGGQQSRSPLTHCRYTCYCLKMGGLTSYVNLQYQCLQAE